MKRGGVVAAVAAFLLVMPMLFMGLLLTIAGDDVSPSELALEQIPPEYLPIYQTAASTCEGLDWTILAAVHKVETGFGSGKATSSAGAQGPMQFMPATFEVYGMDGDADGITDINDLEDAIFSAANLLCANGAGNPERLASAIWNYNHSDEYVNEVLALASSYGVMSVPGDVAHASTTDLLRNPRVSLTPYARADLESGVVDSRLVSLLSWLAQRHSFTVSVFRTGHSKYTRSGSISLHYFGSGADIFIVDGSPVSATNLASREAVLAMASLDGAIRPAELGHPFGAIGFPGGFSDADHADHIHLGFE